MSDFRDAHDAATPTPAFDTIVVPDFSGPQATAFEVRTLIFLGSWLDKVGRSPAFPLHLACVGEPPPSVRWLARRCGARVTVHESYRQGGFFNKQRGLEVSATSRCFLLLDADVIVAGRLDGLTRLGEVVATSPARLPHISEGTWRSIYDRLAVPFPVERIASLAAESGMTPHRCAGYPGQWSDYAAMVPYYNGGIVWAPWECGLRELWREYIDAFGRMPLDGPEQARWIRSSDQGALAVSVQALRGRGVPFSRLPVAYHTQWVQLENRLIDWRDVRLYHAIGMLRDMTHINEFHSALVRHVRQDLKVAARELHRRRRVLRMPKSSERAGFPPIAARALRMALYVERLYLTYAVPAMRVNDLSRGMASCSPIGAGANDA